jgi:hypothetical protein
LTTLEPRQPEPGWTLRWLVQGCALLVRSAPILAPGSVVFAVIAFAAMAAPMTILGPKAFYGMPVLMGAFGSRLIAAAYMLWVISVLMAEDGHRAKVRLTTLTGILLSASFAIGAAVFACVMYGQVISMMLQGVGLPTGIPTRIEDFLALISFAGGIMSSSMADVIVFSGLGLYVWPVLLISLGAGWRQCIGMSPMLLTRVPLVMATFFFSSLALATAAMTLPEWTGFPLEVAWIAWMYVGTREIFAGIVKNGAREKVGAGRLATAAT